MEYMLETKLKRDREVNIDIYVEIGNSDSNKIYPKGLKKGIASILKLRLHS